ncbi:MAG: Fibrobacter succinos major domain (Fib succ major) [Bacteroidetes bacterium]|nr:Fibrobacter succinos major domain (Fib succ major) [Bacteroidota bacterium]
MKFKNLSIFLTAALFFAACSDDTTVGTTSSGEEVAVQLSFKTVSMEQAGSSTRGGSSVLNLGGGDASGIDFSASTTRSVDVSGMDESAISNLWVFQYVTGGSFVRRQYFSSVDVADFRMDLSTNVSGQTSNLYFVANVGPDAFPDVLATESAFKANGIAVTDEASVLPTAGFVPMFGSLSALTLPDDFVNESQVITLTRMVSRVDFSFQLASTGLPSGFLIKSVRLKSVPGKSFPYKDAAATTFPALTDVTLRDFDYEAITATDQTSSAVLLSFYLPENMRGDGTSTTQAGKTGITGATCIQLVGYSDGDEITYNIYPGEDAIANYDLTRNTTYTVSAAITGIYENDARVKKTPLANTYIVRSGSSINIPVKRANQTAALGEQLADITTGWTSSILWRDNSGLTITTDDATLQSEGFFTVKASDMSATGNALVCIKDASNNVLWSWQIWVTSYDPDSENETYNSYTFMDRNLGATSDVAGTATALGLLYQWGRKDPFAGSSVITSGNTTLKTLYSGGSGSTTYTSTNTAAPTTSANNLETAVRNPGVFYYDASTPYDWYCGSSTTQNDVLWGVTKTVYDPCPSGWKVAPVAAFSTWSTSTSTWSTTNLGRTFTAASGSWYPAGGRRVGSSTGTLGNVGTDGFCWSSAVSVTVTLTSSMNFSSSSVNPAYSGTRAHGFGVRCVQEN